ncbi:ATP-binding cassette domain-containing protein, partial [Pseudomonas aeruginosa]
ARLRSSALTLPWSGVLRVGDTLAGGGGGVWRAPVAGGAFPPPPPPAAGAHWGWPTRPPPLPPRQRVASAVLAGRLGQWPLWKSLASLVYPLDRAGAHDALQRLDLGDKLFQRCDQLSGGQLQRVGIARVLYQRAELILADEPVSAMDPVLAGHTLALLNREAAARGSTLLASLHAVDLALQHFPRVIGLRAGRIAFDLPAGEVDRAALDALYANEQLQAERASPAGEPTVVHIPRC